jgi:hypothetical protein
MYRGELKSVRVGRRVLIPRAALEELLGVLPDITRPRRLVLKAATSSEDH